MHENNRSRVVYILCIWSRIYSNLYITNKGLLMRKYWTFKAGIQHPTTIRIPIPTEAEMYILLTAFIMVVVSIWVI